MQLKQKLRAPRHPLAGDIYEPTDDGQQSVDVVDEDYLTRDEFNLHKIIVAVTMPAKVCCWYWNTFMLIMSFFQESTFAFSALTLLVGHQEDHLTCKNWVMRCKHLEQGTVEIACLQSGQGNCYPKTLSFLFSLKSRMVLLLWYLLTQVVLEKRSLNGCFVFRVGLIF